MGIIFSIIFTFAVLLVLFTAFLCLASETFTNTETFKVIDKKIAERLERRKLK